MAQKLFNMADKWGTEIADRGFAQVPNYLLLMNTFRGEDEQLSPLELLLLVQLVGAWWKRNEMPFPSIKTLSQRCGTSERQILRAMAKLEKAKLLQRVKRRQQGLIRPNAYDLGPLVETLDKIAEQYPNAFPRKVRSTAEVEEQAEDASVVKDENTTRRRSKRNIKTPKKA